MSWAKFDDRTPTNPKVALLSDVAFRLWFAGICHCCEHLTDGHIQHEVPQLFPRAPTGKKLVDAIRELERRGLWIKGDGGWEVHDFLDWNPPSEEVRAKREKAKARMRRVRDVKFSRTDTERSREQEENSVRSSSYPVPVPVPVPNNNTPPIPPSGGELQRVEFPRNLDQALAVSPSQRARVLIERPESWQWVEPHKWPEIHQLGADFAAACGWHSPKWTNPQSSAIRRLVGLLAEFSHDDLARAVVAAGTSEWLKTKGLSSLSDEVVRRLLNQSKEAPTRKQAPIQPRSNQSTGDFLASLGFSQETVQ